MFDIAWSELAVIGAVALVVIGPKDLPKVMRTMGQWSRKMRLLASDFQHHVDDMVRQAELDELRRKAEAAAAPFTSEMEGMGDFAKDAEAAAPANVMQPPEIQPVAVPPEPETDEPELPLSGEAKPGGDAKPVAPNDDVADRGETKP